MVVAKQRRLLILALILLPILAACQQSGSSPPVRPALTQEAASATPTAEIPPQTTRATDPNAPLPTPIEFPFTRASGSDFPEGWRRVGTSGYANEYAITVAEEVGPDGQAALHIHSTALLDQYNFNGINRVLSTQHLPQYRGHRVRLSADVKAEGITGQAGLMLRVDGAGRAVAFDNMLWLDAIVGTHDWRRYAVVLDIPADRTESQNVVLGFLLSGPGQVWVSNMRLEPVGAEVDVTDLYAYAAEPVNLNFETVGDDGRVVGWRLGGRHLTEYVAVADSDSVYEGRYSFRLGSNAAPPDAWAGALQKVAATPYQNQRLRLTAQVKTRGVTDRLFFTLGYEGYSQDSARETIMSPNFTGTADWFEVELVLDLADQIEAVSFGFWLHGQGQVWVDDVRLEAVGLSQWDPEQGVTNQQKRIFETLWRLFDGQYIYPDFNGLDWTAVYHDYHAQIEAGLSQEQFWQAMKALIAALEDNHSRFSTPEEAALQAAVSVSQPGYAGIGVMATAIPGDPGHLVIHYAFPDSPAAAAGLQPRDRIWAADGQPVCCDEAGQAYDLVRGPVGTAVSLTVETPGSDPRQVVITREPITAPPFTVSRRLEGDIGYLLLPTLGIWGVAEAAETGWLALNEEGPLNGLIIDLRVNTGGQLEELEGVLALFASGKLGEFHRRSSQRDLIVSGRDVAGSQTIPLVVLIGGWTESSAEVMAGVLQDAGRATLIGQPTMGNVETIIGQSFSDGSQVTIAIELFVPPSGADYNLAGVIPDIPVEQLWREATGDADDEALQLALELLRR